MLTTLDFSPGGTNVGSGISLSNPLERKSSSSHHSISTGMAAAINSLTLSWMDGFHFPSIRPRNSQAAESGKCDAFSSSNPSTSFSTRCLTAAPKTWPAVCSREKRKRFSTSISCCTVSPGAKVDGPKRPKCRTWPS
ncbi:hypothetical protein H113_00636 [Trichophyton rubrum MR1459]|uniref:Uncharacterized protein n=1 Tax=Trichophyton rubrum (strain ATCC MYA-4607 / CBS 118892) TaxID=559305 RepID=A0A080WJC0_TRIRC|nr:uncharacterized protein TERG_12589 [Trichophyton rubrum CBS 118892]EZF99740.1 hypothetical protein H113_00636 [Trichophyton rubrum MR1459]KFL62821.1 hypothetical protein TERG_12589 [Trichophyton rubrum CBS 118892]